MVGKVVEDTIEVQSLSNITNPLIIKGARVDLNKTPIAAILHQC